jgi:glycogenin glucosyltransferase
MHTCAFVTFVMRNDHYVPGALVFAYALKRQGVSADIICLITPEITSKAKKALQTIFDDVITIDPIYVYHPMRHGRQDRPYLFTRFQALRLGKDGDLKKGYQKIVVADADILPISNYQTLLEISAPAGIINESKSHCISAEGGKYKHYFNQKKTSEWHWHYIYRNYPHGHPIPRAYTDRIEQNPNNLGINACLYLLEPNMKDYKNLLKDLKNQECLSKIVSYPWPEMQYFTLKYSGMWHNIDLRYASFNGYPKLDILNGTHFAGLKPWDIKCPSVKSFAKFDDYQLFFRTYKEMFETYPKLQDHKKLHKLYDCFDELLIN